MAHILPFPLLNGPMQGCRAGRDSLLSLLDVPTRSASPATSLPKVRPTDVLVVDDDYVIRSCVADTLEMEGYSVANAANGQLALTLLQRMRAEGFPPPGVILLDMRMPIMDGWHFADAYRLTPAPHAPIVVVTAAHDADKRGAAVGAECVLEKPFDIDRLIEIVQTCANRRGGQPG
jgi:two-component system chemotaxis response regulator CheY